MYFIWTWRHLRFADKGCFALYFSVISSPKTKGNFIYLVAVFYPHTTLNLPPQGRQAVQTLSKYWHYITLEFLANFYLQYGNQQVTPG